MLRPTFLLRAGTARALTATTLLETVRNDPGMTAGYYANRYFGKDTMMRVNHILWNELKRFGKVIATRDPEDPSLPPRWEAVLGRQYVHKVCRHNPDEEDLSLLRQMSAAQTSSSSEAQEAPSGTAEDEEAIKLEVESAVLQVVQALPGKDIQFYIRELPTAVQAQAPAAFRRLREAGIIDREATSQGTYIWH